jgi:hypothetical protein
VFILEALQPARLYVVVPGVAGKPFLHLDVLLNSMEIQTAKLPQD